jgi:hypothetical protein
MTESHATESKRWQKMDPRMAEAGMRCPNWYRPWKSLDLIKGLSLLMSLATLFTVVGYATEPLGSPSSGLDCREQGAFQIVGVMQGGQVVQQHVQGVMAAPNRARIQARVLRAEQSTQDPEKWQLELEILASQTVSGPNFARVGENVQGLRLGQPGRYQHRRLLKPRPNTSAARTRVSFSSPTYASPDSRDYRWRQAS